MSLVGRVFRLASATTLGSKQLMTVGGVSARRLSNSTGVSDDAEFGEFTFQVESAERRIIMCEDGGTILQLRGQPGPSFSTLEDTLDPYVTTED